MSGPYYGEIRIFGGNFAPVGWMFCEGQLLPITDNETLFNLIGTTYGGDGQETFALPDLRGRLPIHLGNGFSLAETGGAETVTLTTSQIPAHTHAPVGSSTGGSSSPSGNTFGAGQPLFSTAAPSIVLSQNPAMVSSAGGSQPHSNFMPYLCVNFIINVDGPVFPTPS